MARGVLVLLLILVAVVAGGILAWPRLADEAALRAALAGMAAAATGEALDIKGAVRLDLVPMPRLSVDRVALGERGADGLEADRVDIAIALAPLLLGRIEPERVQLVRPRLRAGGRPEAWAEALLRAVEAPALDGLRRLTLVDGALALPGGDTLDALDLELARQPERQRLTLAGTARLAGELLRFSAEAEPVRRGAPASFRAELASGPGERAASLTFQGSLRPEPSGLAAEGLLRVALPDGRLPPFLLPLLGRGQGLPTLPAPAALQGRLAVEPGRLSLSELALDLAGDRLRGSLTLDLEAPAFYLALESAQATLTPELERALREALAALPTLPEALRGRVALEVGALAWRGDRVRRLRAEAALKPGRSLALPQLTATLPGETALAWSGRAPAPGASGLLGSLSLQAGDLRPLLLWLGADPAFLPQGGLTSLDLGAEVALGPDRLALDAIAARLDASRITGSAALTPGQRPKLTARLALDRLNTALYWPGLRLPDPASWRERLGAFDLDLELAVERVGHDALRGQGLHLRADLADGRFRLGELRLDGLAGMRARFDGEADLADGGDYALNAALELAQPRGLLHLVGIDLPPELDRLAPLRVSAGLKGDNDAAGIAARLDGAGIAASLEGTMGGPFDPRFLDLSGEARADDAGRLLEALGWVAPPGVRPDLGAFSARLEARRDGGPAALRLESRVGDSDLAGEATLTPGERPRLEGGLKAGLLDTALLRALYDTAALRLGFPPGSPWAWPGAWPTRPLGWGWLDAAELKLALGALRLRHAGQSLGAAAADLTLAHRELTLAKLALPLAHGRLEGAATLEGEGGHAVLAADLRLSGARAEEFAAVLAPGSELEGELDLAAAIAAHGLGIADLVGTLEGEGSVALRDGRLGGIALPGEPAGGAGLAIVELSGPLRIARGVVASPEGGLLLRTPAGEGRAHLRLDLLPWMMEVGLDLPRPAEAGGPAHVRLLGAPGRLRQAPPALPQPGPATGTP